MDQVFQSNNNNFKDNHPQIKNFSPIKETQAQDKELTSERTYNTDVFDLGDNKKKYKIHVGHLN